MPGLKRASSELFDARPTKITSHRPVIRTSCNSAPNVEAQHLGRINGQQKTPKMDWPATPSFRLVRVFLSVPVSLFSSLLHSTIVIIPVIYFWVL